MHNGSQERLESYKNGGRHTEWKDKYRQKCLDRLKSGRKKLQDHFRSMSVIDPSVVSAIAKELSTSIVEEVLTETQTDSTELLNELSEELQALVMEWTLSQEMWESAMEQLENKSVICPICRQDYLREQETVITCGCGLQIENDVINLGQLEKKLDEATSRHALMGCAGKLEFNVVEMEEINLSVLNMQCTVCSINELIV